LHLVSTSFSPRSSFAYLTDLPLTYTREGVFGLCDGFFGSKGIPMEGKMKLARAIFLSYFQPDSTDPTSRYFPPQVGDGNLRE
jgi:hypothetical protein